MPAAVSAAVAASQMIGFGENHLASGVVKIVRAQWLRQLGALVPLELLHATPADAAAVARFIRHTGDERGGNLNAIAPARTFIHGGGAKLAFVWVAAQRAQAGVARIHLGSIFARTGLIGNHR
jgi:hypothetical protein